MVDEFTPKRQKKGKYEKHMYWRRPNKGWHPNWIVVTGVKGHKREMYEDLKGWTLLKEFGELPDGHTNPWEHILTQPGGPEAFPVDQVLTLRWYNPDDLPTDCAWATQDEEPCPRMMQLKQNGVKFPQLSGHKIVERFCPECDRAPFVTTDGFGGVEPLARHLSIVHDWSADRIKKYGEAVGIDFDKAYARASQERTFDFSGTEQTPAVHGDFSCECGWAPDPEKGSAKKQYQGHRMGAHKKEAVPA